MNLVPNPFDAERYKENGVLYVRNTETGELLRVNVAVGIQLYDLDNDRFVFTGTNTGRIKSVATARQDR